MTENASHAISNVARRNGADATLCDDHGITLGLVPPERVDRVDRAIVTRLQADGRIANVDLADAVSLSPSACLRRVKALEDSGLISGYRAEVDRARAGLGLTAFVGLRVQGHSRQTSSQIEQALTAIPAVVACYVISGSDDFMVEVATSDLAGYEQVLLDRILAIPSVTEAHSTFAIRTVLSRGPVPLDHWR
jgi:Lrp/AsnC family leucine-responsive transcriptional regulator